MHQDQGKEYIAKHNVKERPRTFCGKVTNACYSKWTHCDKFNKHFHRLILLHCFRMACKTKKKIKNTTRIHKYKIKIQILLIVFSTIHYFSMKVYDSGTQIGL